MTVIYVDRAALELARGDDRSHAIARPDRDAIDHLVEAGHDVRIVDLDPGDSSRPEGTIADPVPGDGKRWFVTDRPAALRAVHATQIRTLLIGRTTARGSVSRPADVVVRDLRAAVLAILADEAMPAVGG